MNTFERIFESTADFLKSKSVRAKVSRRPIARTDEIRRFNERTGAKLPASFSSFHTRVANGFDFRWEVGEDYCGHFHMPTLIQLGRALSEWDKHCAWLSISLEEGGLSTAAEQPAQARRIVHRMRTWLPFWDEGNGDKFCVELTTGRIVYHQHDWYDGFGSLFKTNGITAGTDLADFLNKWSIFCFMCVKGYWWGKFGKFGAIQWKPEHFESAFTRGDL